MTLLGFSLLMFGFLLSLLAEFSPFHGYAPPGDLLSCNGVIRCMGFGMVVIGFGGVVSDLGHRINRLEDSAYAGGRATETDLPTDIRENWKGSGNASHDIRE